MTRTSLLLSLPILLAPGSAPAADAGDPEAGRMLAQELCSGCHVVGQETSGSDLAPSFSAIANNPDKTLTKLHAWPGGAHPMVPDLPVSAAGIDDLNAYLDSLIREPDGTAGPEPAGRLK